MKDEFNEIGAFEAKTHLSELLRQVEGGAAYLIKRRGKPVARLMPPGSDLDRDRTALLARMTARRQALPSLSEAELRAIEAKRSH